MSKAAKGDGTAILQLGLLVLMLTPVARVVVLAVGWLVDREWRFALVALFVFALLMTSLILGTGEQRTQLKGCAGSSFGRGASVD